MSRIYRVTVKGHYSDGTLAEPGWHVKVDVPAAGSEPPADDVAAAIWSHVGSGFLYCLDSNVTVASLDVREVVLPPAIGDQGTHTVGSAGTSPESGSLLPDGLSAIMRFRTGTASRSARGWMFMPAARGSGALNNGKWSTTYLADLNATGGSLKDHITMGGTFPPTIVPVVYSRTRELRSETPFSFDVSSVVADATPHWLRSRMTNP